MYSKNFHENKNDEILHKFKEIPPKIMKFHRTKNEEKLPKITFRQKLRNGA
jgi:hypothetical protein